MSNRKSSVEYRDVSKYFGTNEVLKSVSFEVQRGSIKALLGANGSGKSTLIKILAGYHAPSSGAVLVDGHQLDYPVTAQNLSERGVRFLHQDLGLIEGQSVGENIALGVGFPTRRGWIDWREHRRQVVRDLERVGLQHLDPKTPVAELGPVERTLVAMARSLHGLTAEGAGLLVLDEPTARLPRSEVDALLARCLKLRDEGISMVYVSHRLDEVFAMADEIVVMRDGALEFDGKVSSITPDRVTSMITGSRQEAVKETDPEGIDRGQKHDGAAEPRMSVLGLSGPHVKDVGFEIYPGEIVALTGLVGSGKSEVGRLIYGAQDRTSGSILLDGDAFDPVSKITDRVEAGVGYVPQDRRDGGFAGWTLVENTTIAGLSAVLGRLGISRSRSLAKTQHVIQDLDVRPPDPYVKLQILSGGNQQKIIVGKWLTKPLRFLILDEPTYGVDVGARNAIMTMIQERAEEGLAVLLIDSDIDLVAQVADRVLIMRHGEVMNELRGEKITPSAIAQHSYAVDNA